MEFFSQLHWSIFALALGAFVYYYNKRVGNIKTVHKRLVAELKPVDPRFESGRFKAEVKYVDGETRERLDIKLANTNSWGPMKSEDLVEFYINGVLLAKAKVNNRKEAEYDEWHFEEDGYIPVEARDTIEMKCQGEVVVSGVFKKVV